MRHTNGATSRDVWVHLDVVYFTESDEPILEEERTTVELTPFVWSKYGDKESVKQNKQYLRP